MSYDWLVKHDETGKPYKFWDLFDSPQYGSNNYANPEYLRTILRKYSEYNKPNDWIEDPGGNELSIDQLQAAWNQNYKPEGFDDPINQLQNKQDDLLKGIGANGENEWNNVYWPIRTDVGQRITKKDTPQV